MSFRYCTMSLLRQILTNLQQTAHYVLNVCLPRRDPPVYCSTPNIWYENLSSISQFSRLREFDAATAHHDVVDRSCLLCTVQGVFRFYVYCCSHYCRWGIGKNFLKGCILDGWYNLWRSSGVYTNKDAVHPVVRERRAEKGITRGLSGKSSLWCYAIGTEIGTISLSLISGKI